LLRIRRDATFVAPGTEHTMLTREAAALVLLAVVATTATSQQSTAPSRTGVVLVRAVDKDGGSIVGNGVVVGTADQIATERSMLAGAATVSVIAAPGSSPVAASIVSIDTVTGIAILRAPGLQVRPATIARRAVAMNDSVVVVTVAPDQAPTVQRGKVRKVEAFVGTELATLSAAIPAEMNGAPVTNAAGELVGIAFVTVVGGASTTYTIPTRSFAKLLAEDPRPRPTATVAAAQPAASSARTAAEPPRASDPEALRFSAKGLEYEQTIMAIYAGQFQNVDLKREEMKFGLFFGAYVETCSVHCASSLPPNKVELTMQVCKTERRTVNGYGVQVGGSTCVAWETVGTGRYADPEVYAAMRHLDASTAVDGVREMMSTVMQGNAVAAAGNLLGVKQKMLEDMRALIRMNGCTSPGMKRFQDNLRFFATRAQPIQIGGAEGVALASSTRPLDASNITSADFAKLVEDLVADQAKTWMMNRYVPSSVRGVRVSERDAAGRPAKVVGTYAFEGFQGRSGGTVAVVFANGVPECVHFSDAPQTCRTPSRKIVTAYANGGYPAP
jgi:hypothetical protein